MTEIYFDGSITENPGGQASFGLVVKINNKIVYKKHGKGNRGKKASNNTAEFAGVIAALEYVSKKSIVDAKIYGDSLLVINLLNGKYKPDSSKLYYPFYVKAKALIEELDVTLAWVPRSKNADADRLSRPPK